MQRRDRGEKDSMQADTSASASGYTIGELVDLEEFRGVLQDYTAATGFPTALISHPDQEVLIAAGWHRICTDFHRQAPGSERHCRASDHALAVRLEQMRQVTIHHCRNGLVDGATPIVVEGLHLANLFIGQVLLEKPDLERFRRQAEQYGFSLDPYLQALAEVPVVSERDFRNALSFLRRLAVLVVEQGLLKLKALEAAAARQREISRLEAAERELRAERDFSRTVIAATPAVICGISADGTTTFINPAGEQVTGYSRDEIVGRNWWKTMYPGTSYAQVERLLSQMESGEVRDWEMTLTTKAGAQRTVSWTSHKLLDGAGQVQEVLSFGIDITRRRQFARELQEARDFLEAAVAHSPSGIIIADAPSGDLRVANPAACRIWGTSIHKLTDAETSAQVTPWRAFQVDGSPYPVDEMPLPMALKHGTITRGETVIIRDREGQEHWVSIHAAPMKDAQGRIIAAIMVLHEITERVLAEQEKKRLEEQLRQSQKMDAVGRLAGGVAHDFNNILTGINGSAEMLLANMNAVDPLRADLEEILAAGRRAAELTQQLLAFSRKQIISPRIIRPDRVLESSQNMLRRIIGEDIDLVFTADENLGRIRADPAQLDQILVNLSVNARDAMPDGGRLNIEIRNVSLRDEPWVVDDEAVRISGEYVMLVVRDTGIGMDRETQEQVFEPFFSTKPKGVGVGLGLATVYGIVRQSEGFIKLSSEVGMGTAFQLYFPRVDAAAMDTDSQAADATEPLPGGDETILLAEDEATVRRLARRILERQGYAVLDAASGTQALELGRGYDGRIALLLTDVIMPAMNGRELYEQLRESFSDLKVIFMSGYTENVIAQRAVLDEDTHFLQKPFTMEELTNKVRSVLDG